MLLDVEYAMKQGYTKVSIRTVDTVVVVLAVAAAERLSIDQLWVAFGTGVTVCACIRFACVIRSG